MSRIAALASSALATTAAPQVQITAQVKSA